MDGEHKVEEDVLVFRVAVDVRLGKSKLVGKFLNIVFVDETSKLMSKIELLATEIHQTIGGEVVHEVFA